MIKFPKTNLRDGSADRGKGMESMDWYIGRYYAVAEISTPLPFLIV
jgi:hypothetical protein